jgi:hypothetical protein
LGGRGVGLSPLAALAALAALAFAAAVVGASRVPPRALNGVALEELRVLGRCGVRARQSTRGGEGGQ